VFRVFATLGLDKGALRYISHYKGKNDFKAMRTTVWATIGTTTILSIFFITIYKIGFFSQIIFLFPSIPELDHIFQIIIYLLPMIVLSEIINNLLTGIEKPQHVQVVQKILLPITRLLLLLVLVYFFTRLDAFLYATFLSQTFALLVLIIVFIKLFRESGSPSNLSENLFDLKQFIMYSLPLTLIPIFNLSTQQIDTLIIGHFMDAKETGVYAIVRRIGEMVLIPLTMVAGIFSAQASRMYSQERIQDIKALYLFSTKWTYIFSAFIFLIFYLEADFFLKLFGDEFVIGAKPLQVFILGHLINASFGPNGFLLLMLHKSKLVLFNSLISAIVGVLLAYYLIKDYGLLGATTAMTITIIVVNILAMLQLYFLFDIVPCSLGVFFKRLGLVLGNAYLTTLVLTYTKVDNIYSHLGVTSIIIFLLFPILLYLFEGFSEDDKIILKLIERKTKRFVNNKVDQ